MKLAPLLLLLTLAGCGRGADAPATQAPLEPAPLVDTECAVCGMSVAEQASPRGQVVHRDGQHKHFCSIGDLVVYLQTPGPLGQPAEVWVEVLPDDLDPAAHDPAPQPWIPAREAVYQIGPERRVMGTPVLTWRSATGRHAETFDWNELKRRLAKP